MFPGVSCFLTHPDLRGTRCRCFLMGSEGQRRVPYRDPVVIGDLDKLMGRGMEQTRGFSELQRFCRNHMENTFLVRRWMLWVLGCSGLVFSTTHPQRLSCVSAVSQHVHGSMAKKNPMSCAEPELRKERSSEKHGLEGLLP